MMSTDHIEFWINKLAMIQANHLLAVQCNDPAQGSLGSQYHYEMQNFKQAYLNAALPGPMDKYFQDKDKLYMDPAFTDTMSGWATVTKDELIGPELFGQEWIPADDEPIKEQPPISTRQKKLQEKLDLLKKRADWIDSLEPKETERAV